MTALRHRRARGPGRVDRRRSAGSPLPLGTVADQAAKRSCSHLRRTAILGDRPHPGCAPVGTGEVSASTEARPGSHRAAWARRTTGPLPLKEGSPMTCAPTSRKLPPDSRWGDLDAEPAADVAAHLKDCARVPHRIGRAGRTLGRSARDALPPRRLERRSAAVAAMARAHSGDLSERPLTRRPRPWAPGGRRRVPRCRGRRSAASPSASSAPSSPSRRHRPDPRPGDPATGGRARRRPEDRPWATALVTDPARRGPPSAGATEILLDQDTSARDRRPPSVTPRPRPRDGLVRGSSRARRHAT